MFSVLSDLLSNGFLFFLLHIQQKNTFPPPLSKEEEEKYLAMYAEGSECAKKKLIEHNLRLVAHIVKKYYPAYAEQDDLISIGTIGLIKGIQSFDNSKNIRLATYASRCIENEILMYFRGQKKISQDISINEPIENDSEGNPLTLMDIICVDDTIADDIDLKIKLEKLSGFLNKLKDKREKEILELRYGLNGETPLTQRETAKLLHISRSYVSRIEKRTLEKLQKMYW